MVPQRYDIYLAPLSAVAPGGCQSPLLPAPTSSANPSQPHVNQPLGPGPAVLNPDLSTKRSRRRDQRHGASAT